MYNKLFLLWLVSFLAILGAGYFAFEEGFFSFIWNIDVSKLCFVILAVFLFGYLKLGRMLYISSKSDRMVYDSIGRVSSGYEIADTCMTIGMLGTVIGFIVMSSSFASVDFSNIENIKELFKVATVGMSTALYTTAFGLVSSLILRATYFISARIHGLAG